MAAQITADRCTPLATAPGHMLRSDAAAAWDAAVRAFGPTVLLTDSWRSYAVQERIFRERYAQGNYRGRPGFTADVRYWQGAAWTRRAGTAAAAVPGTSNHGSGLSVDVKTRRSAGDPAHPAAVVFAGFSDVDRLRFLTVARPYGWADDEGRSVAEPWHLTYYPARDTRPAVPTAPPPEQERTMRIIRGADRPECWVTDGLAKRYVATPEELAQLLLITGQVSPQVIGQYGLDRIPVATTGLTDAAQVAEAVLASLTPERIAAAVPGALAAQVADVLAARLAS